MSNTGYQPPKIPALKPVSMDDIWACLRAGRQDFFKAPMYGLFFGGIYAAGGLLIFAALTVLDMNWMIIPVAVGFPLVGPFVAVGLYEVSRRLREGEPLVWGEILGVVFRQSKRQLGWMAFIILFIFWIWIYQVRLMLAIFLSSENFSNLGHFIEVLFTTANGIGFLIVGTGVGAVLAFVLFSSTVISMPLLLDKELDFVTAMVLSFKTVLNNLVPMVTWGVVVTALAIIAMVPAFVGMIVILPILGHATWHLYECAVEREEAPPQPAAAEPDAPAEA